MSSPQVEVVLQNVCQSIGEGPHWDPALQSLFFVDIDKGAVCRWDSATSQVSKVHLQGTVSLVVPRREGGLVVGLSRKLSLLEWETATVTTLAEVDTDQTTTRLNDGKADANGRLWAGTMGKVDGQPVGSFYSLDTARQLQKHESGIGVSNGLCWTGDNRTMFYIDTDTHKVAAYDFDLERGQMSNKRTAVDCGDLRPDGMTIDTDDKLWVACFGSAVVYKYDPATGQTIQKIDIPGAKQTTSVTWGGPNLDVLYLTSGRSISDEEFQNQPNAGSLFRITGTGSKGRAPFVYQG